MPVDPNAALRDGDCSAAAPAGALNRGDFVAALARAKTAADASAHAFALCLVDVDQLRNINACHGQRSGDAAILGVAGEILHALALPEWRRLEAGLGRYDGDTFIVLLRDCRLDAAVRLAEALRARVASRVRAGVPVTVSIGVASYRLGETIDALLARTEQALNLAKQFGRDRVEAVATPEVRNDARGIATLD